MNGGRAKPWYIGGKNVARAIYFVSATPVNPTLEQEEENENPLDDAKFDEKVKEAIARTRKIIQGFIGDKRNVKGKKFFEIMDELKVKKWPSEVKLTRMVSWVAPKAAKKDVEHFPERKLMEAELLGIRHFLKDGLSYQEEYAYTVGLIRTKYNRKNGNYILLRTRRGKWNCFGFPYETLHFPHQGKIRNALKWLLEENTSIKRLINTLLSEGVLESQKGRVSLSQKKKKALIFCTHRGVAMGLSRALKWFLEKEAKGSSNSSPRLTEVDKIPPIAYDGERIRWTKDYTERLINGFNEKRTNPVILIATDKLSESLDLHRSCKLLIHYELPWSPLRLFQRVGRLTRLKAWGQKTVFNNGVRVGHIMVPGSVAEERVNRLIRRISFLSEENLWPEKIKEKNLIMGLIGAGPSMHLVESFRKFRG